MDSAISWGVGGRAVYSGKRVSGKRDDTNLFEGFDIRKAVVRQGRNLGSRHIHGIARPVDDDFDRVRVPEFRFIRYPRRQVDAANRICLWQKATMTA